MRGRKDQWCEKHIPAVTGGDLSFQKETQKGGSQGVLTEMLSFCIISFYRILKSLAEGKAHSTGKRKLLKKMQKANRQKSSNICTIQSACLFFFHRDRPSSP